jgi:ABC-2 type transport system permease protein
VNLLRPSLAPFSRLYRAVFGAGIRMALAYRGFFFLQFGFQLIPLATQVFLWSAVFRTSAAGTQVGGLGKSQMLTYFLLMNLLGLTSSADLSWEMSTAIRQGNLSQFLLKPFSYGLYQWHLAVGKICIELLYLALPAGLVLGLAHGFLSAPAEGWRWAAFILSLVLGIQISFLTSFLIGACAFWVLENSSFLHMMGPIQMLLAGSWFPLTLLPKTLATILLSLPFAYQQYFPVTVYLGTADWDQTLRGLGIQCLWIAGMWAASVMLWKRGTKAYVAVGG